MHGLVSSCLCVNLDSVHIKVHLSAILCTRQGCQLDITSGLLSSQGKGSGISQTNELNSESGQSGHQSAVHSGKILSIIAGSQMIRVAERNLRRPPIGYGDADELQRCHDLQSSDPQT
jgi:hypothetical protein